MEKDCIFCKIVSGEISAERILEGDNFIVIEDAHPKVNGHLLVIPKKHFKTLLDIPSLMFNEFMDITKSAAIEAMKITKAEGFNLEMNNFEAAGQVVPHAHLHILPRKKGDGFKMSL
jgi:histidine triad (HIT) family protein